MQSGGLRTKGVIKQSQENMPLITVITVVYNGEKTLEETILSVINQTYKNIEYIIIDGASTDNTLEIVKKYEDRIDYWISEPDNGIYYAMNKGIGLASGDYIAMLNSDDWYELNTCAMVAKSIQQNSADVFYGMMRIYDDKIFQYVYGYSINMISKKMIAHPSCFISQNVYSTTRYNTLYKSAADYDLIIRLFIANCKFFFIENVLVNFRMSGMSSSITGQKESNTIRKKYNYISFFSCVLRNVFIVLRYFLSHIGI
jgi:glycosyltransferase involved in cell wall biosynthesis